MAVTPKEQLLSAIEDLSESEAAEVLQIILMRRELDSETATRILDGIPGAYDQAQLGLQQAREGNTTSLDDLRRARGLS